MAGTGADSTATSDAAAQKTGEQKTGDAKTVEQTTAEHKTTESATEQKTGESKAAAARKTEEAKPASKVPDKYDLKIPDNAQTFVDDRDLAEFAVDARAAGYTNEEAQDAVNAHAEALAARSAKFRADTQADPTLGGAHFADTERLMTLGLDRLAPAGTELGDELRRDLQKSGFIHKRSVVAYLRAAGALMAEDRPGAGGGGGGDTREFKTPADLYKKTTPGDPSRPSQ